MHVEQNSDGIILDVHVTDRSDEHPTVEVTESIFSVKIEEVGLGANEISIIDDPELDENKEELKLLVGAAVDEIV